jgi:hypothetical protein
VEAGRNRGYLVTRVVLLVPLRISCCGSLACQVRRTWDSHFSCRARTQAG